MSRASRTERSQRGFTLLEILVALAVFAIASAIAYSGLSAVASTKSSLDREIRFWRELGLIFDRMEMDFTQTLPHLLRTGDGQLYPPVQARSVEDAGGFSVELARYDAERTPVHVIYRCDNGELSLSIEPVNGRQANGATPAEAVPVHPLLHNLVGCEAAFLDGSNVWRASWPSDPTQIRPRAIRIRLSLEARGKFERVYYLP